MWLTVPEGFLPSRRKSIATGREGVNRSRRLAAHHIHSQEAEAGQEVGVEYQSRRHALP